MGSCRAEEQEELGLDISEHGDSMLESFNPEALKPGQNGSAIFPETNKIAPLATVAVVSNAPVPDPVMGHSTD